MEDKALRDHSYDIAKGLGIIMVVFGHAERGLSISGMPTHFSLMGFIDYTIYTFHMPFFSSCLDFFLRKKCRPDRFSYQTRKEYRLPLSVLVNSAWQSDGGYGAFWSH